MTTPQVHPLTLRGAIECLIHDVCKGKQVRDVLPAVQAELLDIQQAVEVDEQMDATAPTVDGGGEG